MHAPIIKDGVVVVVMQEQRFLMIRRAAGIPAAGWWCFVGGALEPTEAQPEAVIREFREEIGGWVRPIAKIWEHLHCDRSLRLHWWLAQLLEGELRPNPAEVAEVRWCTADEIEALPNLLDGNRLFLREVGRSLVELPEADGT
ncbi:MAG: NUDIX domain-containing protein [Planctomycetes bacterium]|nr:NUDIX domain-containing protein [Planctomycetota bacterium]